MSKMGIMIKEIINLKGPFEQRGVLQVLITAGGFTVRHFHFADAGCRVSLTRLPFALPPPSCGPLVVPTRPPQLLRSSLVPCAWCWLLVARSPPTSAHGYRFLHVLHADGWKPLQPSAQLFLNLQLLLELRNFLFPNGLQPIVTYTSSFYFKEATLVRFRAVCCDRKVSLRHS